jgi:hypothetical protein
MQAIKRMALLVCALAVVALPATASATITTKTIDYGPYTIPAGNGDPHDHENAGMISNEIVTNVAKPCTGCTIIGVTPDLVYTDGTRATISQGPMLHHAMFAAQSSGKADATCAGKGPGLLGERFFASGDERTAIDLTSQGQQHRDLEHGLRPDELGNDQQNGENPDDLEVRHRF